MNRKEKVQALMNDSKFVKMISSLENAEDVQKAFAKEGVEFSLEDISQIAELAAQTSDDELTEGQMNSVSGGILAEIAIVASGVSLLAGVMSEVNKSRKAAGKKTIW